MKPYTSGPWRVSANNLHVVSTKSQVAKIWMMRDGEGIANARLIAAAPEIMEALEDLVQLIDDMRDGVYSPDGFTTQSARAAIRKAKGEGE